VSSTNCPSLRPRRFAVSGGTAISPLPTSGTQRTSPEQVRNRSRTSLTGTNCFVPEPAMIAVCPALVQRRLAAPTALEQVGNKHGTSPARTNGYRSQRSSRGGHRARRTGLEQARNRSRTGSPAPNRFGNAPHSAYSRLSPATAVTPAPIQPPFNPRRRVSYVQTGVSTPGTGQTGVSTSGTGRPLVSPRGSPRLIHPPRCAILYRLFRPEFSARASVIGSPSRTGPCPTHEGGFRTYRPGFQPRGAEGLRAGMSQPRGCDPPGFQPPAKPTSHSPADRAGGVPKTGSRRGRGRRKRTLRGEAVTNQTGVAPGTSRRSPLQRGWFRVGRGFSP
jgi:hypothetical protein